ncbi:MAG: DUF1565 domain-containing protein [Bacteroidales bacterium]|nr:DUF1565 domain-containing protein [Bacteroidales bacterium]
MKILLQIFVYTLLLSQTTLAGTLIVKQDSTGDYTTIQAAVDAAVDGDTVLVWPGTYDGNIKIYYKGITVGSLVLTTGDISYMHQTIIDGNDTVGSFDIYQSNNPVVINGFTLQNGIAMWDGGYFNSGGAIVVWYSHANILNCIIQNNFAIGSGGGIYYAESQGVLSNTIIRNNQTYHRGGGILAANSTIEFDSINKCNIYLNYAGTGTDVYNTHDGNHPMHVIVDTFTVLNPDYYYLYEFTNPGGILLSNDIANGKITPSFQDLYVAPDGDNNNSGLTPGEPLKTISYALLKMASDSLSPDTIHVANGVYSPSIGEKFPLSLKRDVSIQGENRDETILNAENKIYHMYGIANASNYKVSKLTLTNGNGNTNSPYDVGSIRFFQNDNTLYKDLLFTQNRGDLLSSVYIRQSNGVVFKNVDFIDNIGGKTFRAGSNPIEGDDYYDTTTLINCRFIRNNLNDSIPDGGPGGGLSVMSQLDAPGIGTCVLYNCLFENHETSGTMVSAFEAGHAYLINCTMADNNSSSASAVVGVVTMSQIKAYNSIFYDNHPAEFVMFNEFPDWGDSKLSIYNSDVAGGEDDIRILTAGNVLYYDQTNIDTDPIFLNKWDHPYQIDNGSPCIDAGTLANLPDFIELPEFDLAGNPRIVGDSIDMGAYEWNPTVGVDEYLPVFKKEKPKLLSAAPNPFSWETTISAKWDFTRHVQIEIYNNAGLRVKVLKSGASGPGSIQTQWQGDDQNGNILPAGIYHVVMFWEGREVDVTTVIKK